MQTKAKNNSLTKKVLFSILAAGMLSGFVLSAEAADSIIMNNAGEYTRQDVDADYVVVSNGADLTLQNSKVEGKNTEIYTLDASDSYPKYNVKSAQVAAYVSGSGSKLTANNVAFTGEVAANDSAQISITGGSITAGRYDYRLDPGTPASEENTTNVLAYNNGQIELNKVDIKSNISAYSGGVITVKDSNVDAPKEIRASGTDSKINFTATDTTKKYTIDVGWIEAENGAKITIDNVNVKINKDKNEYGLIKATGANSQVELNNSKITAFGLLAESGGKLTLAKDSTATVDYIGAQEGGTLEINGNVKAESVDTYGECKIYFTGGADTVYEITKRFTVGKDSLYIYGGTLKSDQLGYLYEDSRAILDKEGKISTISNIIYEHEASATEQDSGAITIKGIVFTGGELILNDAEYTVAYAQSAQAKLAEKGNTKLIMAGDAVDENGEAKDTISVQEAAASGSDIDYDKLTAKAKGNLLIGGNASLAEGINVRDHVDNGFAVGSLDLANGSSEGVIITNDKEVTLGGSKGGSLITVGGEDKNVKVVVGTTSDVAGAASKTGNLNIGNALATADTKYTLNGEIIVNESSNLNIKGQLEITDSLTLNEGTVDVNIGSLKTKELLISGASNLLGKVNVEKLELSSSSSSAPAQLFLGGEETAGKLTVDEATLHGGLVFLDPAWKDGMTISDASGLAVKNITSADGAYVAGRNSVLALGADLQAVEDKFAKTGQAWGKNDISAAAYIAAPVDVASGSLTVNGSLVDDKSVPTTVPANGSVSFAANSLLMVDAAKAAVAPLITGVNTANIDANAKLYIDEAKKGETYKILAGTANGWKEESIISNNSLFKFTKADDADAYTLTTSIKAMDEAFGDDQVTASNAYDAALKAQSEGDAAYDFIMAATDNRVNASAAAQVNALNSATAMGELAGVEHSTYAVSSLLTDAVAGHMSLASDKQHDSDIWAKYIHTKENIDGLPLANFGAKYDAQYNGIVVGADLYKKGKAAIGAALTYADGNINGHSLAARTKNEATYYGASIYGGIQSGDSAIIGDISYLHGKHDITQYNSGKTLTADAKSDAFSIGVRAEKSVKAGVGKFVPYAGLRYMHLGTGNYTNSIGMSYDGDDMNLWLLPVGVKYSAEVKTGSWTLRPVAELGYVWNMGDREATQTVSLNGASDGFGYDVTDSGSYIGRFGVEAQKANVTYGLGYEYQKGDSVKANRWTAHLNWSF